MFKSVFVFFALVIFASTLVSAAPANQGGSGGSGATTQPLSSLKPSGNQVQNQVQTQNMGSESALQVNTAEQLSSSQGVSDAVHDLLAMPDRQGGIGQQVRVIAQAQNDAQQLISGQLKQLESRSNFVKRLIGADHKAIQALKQEQLQNQLRIESLEQLLTETKNQSEIDQIQLAIEALVAQNTELGVKISESESTPSLFGWMFRFFGLQ